MKQIHVILMSLLGLLGQTLPAMGAAESPAGPQITAIDVGWQGHFKMGHWTPVRITIDGGAAGFSGRVDLTATDGDDQLARFSPNTAQPLSVAAGTQWTGWRYVQVGRTRTSIRALLRDRQSRVVAERSSPTLSPLASTSQWVVTAGSDVGVKDAAVFLARMRDEQLVSTVLESAEDFPDQWYGYDGVSILLVPTGSQTLLEQLSDAQFEALLRWLRLGGRFVVSSGRRAGELFQPEQSFYPLRPGRFVELDPYWKASGLENFARAGERIEPNADAPLAVFDQLRGRPLCLEGAGGSDDRALVTQYAVGLGDVTFVALDLDAPPLSDWPARPRLLARLLQTRTDEEDSAMSEKTTSQVTHVGYDDVAGQLRAALDQFPQVTLVQFSWVAAIIAAYIVLLGPLDYFLLRHLGRPQWTWITFPLLVLLFSGLAVWLAGRWKGSRLQVNHVDIVDIDLTEQLVRGTTWTNIYSPRAVSLDINETRRSNGATPAGEGDRRATAALVSWQGLPGNGMGGMSTPGTVDVLRDQYRRDAYRINYPLAPTAATDSWSITGLPIQSASTKGLLARWYGAAAVQAAGSLSTDQFDLLQGQITNPLDVELTHCSIYYQNWAYPLEHPLAPGGTARLSGQQPLDLRWRLMGRRVVGTREVRSTWRRDDLSDTHRILNIVMFYGAAGGHAYTGLSHNYLSFVDLSRHLACGRAVLVGRSAEPATDVAIQSSAATGTTTSQPDVTRQQWTYYRIIFPVNQGEQNRTD